MKKLALLTVIYLASSSAFASYLERCEYGATVTAVDSVATLNESINQHTTVATLTIETATDLGSHIPTACDSRLNKTVLLRVKDQEIEIGNKATLEYFYVENQGPLGPVFSEKWHLLAIDKLINN